MAIVGSFENEALHSPHPYLSNSDLVVYLRTPIVVSDTDDSFYYRDVAIVQPGQSGSSFPSTSFQDYVVVEASNDGISWKPLEDGYDASLHDDWLTRFETERGGSPNLLKPHFIQLRDHFNAGENDTCSFQTLF